MIKTEVALLRNASSIGRERGSSPRNNVVSFLEHHREYSPDHPALIWADAQVSFAELASRSESLAAGLAAMGLLAGDRVFLFIPMSPELYTAMLAVHRVGAIAVFLDSWARRGELESCLAQTSPHCFIGSEDALHWLRGRPTSIAIMLATGTPRDPSQPCLTTLANTGYSIPVAPVDGEHTALVTYTTGSSGKPRGANRTHRFLAAQHRALAKCLPYSTNDIDLPVFPIFSLNNLACGVTTVLPTVDLAQPGETDGDELFQQMLAAKVTTCTLSPSLLRATARAAQRRGCALPHLRRCATGGAPISREDVAACSSMAPNAQVCILYGSTEVEPISHITHAATEPALDGEGVCVGRIADGLEYKMVRITREPIRLGTTGWKEWEVRAGMPGELVVCGEHVCEGYYRNSDAFLHSKICDAKGHVWHRPGDVCWTDAQERLWIVGRVHNAICRGGEILFPVRPEVLMKRLPFVACAAYLGLPDPALGERTCAAFSAHSLHVSPNMVEAVRNALQREQIPVDEVRWVQQIPLDPRHHSKVQYSLLREQLLAEKPPC